MHLIGNQSLKRLVTVHSVVGSHGTGYVRNSSLRVIVTQVDMLLSSHLRFELDKSTSLNNGDRHCKQANAKIRRNVCAASAWQKA